ncbi:Flagellar motor switch protein FliN [Candidatus Bealeia paramacronuclearis]|uniref:Flagellar motor switch protein FliN n=2 Tax=Candidatus Bealeia paramacronuclearis TaxID=1921001 RepID=A0ABZ2C465_9PROT|nr:Flagellar motor switch protein FliN [Candidatus Bealeia paramacronuclearis]
MSDEEKLELPEQDEDTPIDDSMLLDDNEETALEPMLTSTKPDEPLQAIYDVPVQVSAVLGKASMQVSQLLKLGRGAVVELDRRVGDAIDVYVNDRLVARGEVVIVDDHLGVTMTEIIKSDKA